MNASAQMKSPVEGVEITGRVTPEYGEILTPEAVRFVADLAHWFEPRRRQLLRAQENRQRAILAGGTLDFLEETRSVRESDWTVAPIPHDLQDRRVEITGPTDRKMIINALNSGANCYMADFEDSNTPTWDNLIQGQINLRDAVRRTIRFEGPDQKSYQLAGRTATLLVRPRGWHLPEKHMLKDGRPVSGSLFDFGLFFFHNAREQLSCGTGPYFYLPKLQSHREARLWNDVFLFAQERLGIAHGSIRATVLIETIHGAFEMDEILWELREHSSGLNCGRWDYIFSFIKTFGKRPEFLLPDRDQVTMNQPFMDAYVSLCIRTCHRRGIHAMGGMAAQIPIKNDPEANKAAFEKVRQDKLREVHAGHDGTWVAHPALVSPAREVFDAHMKGPNQIEKKRDDVSAAAGELLKAPKGEITEKGLRHNIDVGIQYLESWLRGVGCVPIYNLMEDAATAEISRTQLWQWLQQGARINDGRRVTAELVKEVIPEELQKIQEREGKAAFEARRYALAARLFEDLMLAEDCPPFLTLKAYDYL
jgi:malate synthase